MRIWYRSPLVYSSIAILTVFTGSVHAQNPRSKPPVDQSQYRSESIARDGFDLYYRALGSGEPILILGGGPGDDCDYMLPVALEAAKHGTAILLEQRGTGRSLPLQIDKSTINLALYLQDFEALRKHLKAQRWTVIGHSAGGVLAMDYASAFPDNIDKLILLDTVPVAFQYLTAFGDNVTDRLTPEDRDRLAKLEKTDTPQSRAGLAELQTQALFFNRRKGQEMAGELSRAWHADVGHLLGPEITAPGYDLRPSLTKFQQPVLVMNGRQDPMDPLMAYETSAAFKRSTLRFIDQAGHFPWFEQPVEFGKALGAFLSNR